MLYFVDMYFPELGKEYTCISFLIERKLLSDIMENRILRPVA